MRLAPGDMLTLFTLFRTSFLTFGDGWFPEERISVEEALRAYTINNARAAFEGDLRGSFKAGKLADVTVFDRNMLAIAPADILKAEVTHTIVGGKIVFTKD